MPDTLALLGARNLLENCAGLQSGQSLLLLAEEATEGYYDAALADTVAKAATGLGLHVTRHDMPFHPDARAPDDQISQAMAAADRTLFLARAGDQLRFSPLLAKSHPVVSYALDVDMLGSGFGRAHHGAFVALKDCVNAAMAAAGHIRVTCPLGTDFEGAGAAFPTAGGEVTIARFPLSVFAPVPTRGFRGRIAQAGFLTGTGAHYYQPYNLALRDALMIHFEAERLIGFEGDPDDVIQARAHYDRTGAQLGIAPDFIHSWHAGIHPGCRYMRPAGADPARWGGAAFGNPRVLHFHSCGEVAPGEISINVIDPTIALDGIKVWDAGRLFPDRIPGGAEILAQYPCAAALFADPCREIGLDATGRLSALAL